GDRRLSQTRRRRLHRLRRDGRALYVDTGPWTHRSRARRRRDHLAWAKAPIAHARHQIACRTICAFASRVTPASLLSERGKRLAAKPKPSTRPCSVFYGIGTCSDSLFGAYSCRRTGATPDQVRGRLSPDYARAHASGRAEAHRTFLRSR